jgi:adenosylhomocysteine nucleosidase
MGIGHFIRLLAHRVAAEQVKQTVGDNFRPAPGERAQNQPGDDAPHRDGRHRDAHAGDSHEQPPSSVETSQALVPCHVAIVFALSLESGHLEDRLSGLVSTRGHGFTVRTGGLHGRGVAVAISGPGKRAARQAALAVLAGHRPHWLIAAGFAGGLKPEIKQGDIIVADSVVGLNGERLSIDVRHSTSNVQGVHFGRLLTVDHIVRKAGDKRQYGEHFGALAVDMESLAVAQVCQEEKQRFLAVRAITDAVDDELPRDVERLLNRPTMVRKLGAAAGSVIRRPSAVKDLWNLRHSAAVAADRLASFLCGVIEQLPE